MPAISSPCRLLCRLDDASGLCVGCGRTMDEIAAWSSLGEDERRITIAMLPARLAAAGHPVLARTEGPTTEPFLEADA